MTGRSLDPYYGPRFCRRWSGDGDLRHHGRQRRDHLCRKYWRDGGDESLFHAGVCRRGGHCNGPRFFPKFGALIHAIPAPVIGGASIVVFGLIVVACARIWVQNHVDFSQNSNLIMVATTLVLGAGDFSLNIGGFTLGGIGTATFGAILLNAILHRRSAALAERVRRDSRDNYSSGTAGAAFFSLSFNSLRITPQTISAPPRIAAAGNLSPASRPTTPAHIGFPA